MTKTDRGEKGENKITTTKMWFQLLPVLHFHVHPYISTVWNGTFAFYFIFCHKYYSELFTSGILIVPYCEIVWRKKGRGKNMSEKNTWYETAPVCLFFKPDCEHVCVSICTHVCVCTGGGGGRGGEISYFLLYTSTHQAEKKRYCFIFFLVTMT